MISESGLASMPNTTIADVVARDSCCDRNEITQEKHVFLVSTTNALDHPQSSDNQTIVLLEF